VAVVVYSRATCSYCAAVKRYLKDHRVAFREIDVSHNAQAAAQIKSKVGKEVVPVIDVNGRLIVGFDKRRLNAALGIKG